MRTRLISARVARRLPALLALLLLTPFLTQRPGLAAPARAEFGANVRVNQTQRPISSKSRSLAINPTNPQMVIAAAKDWRNGHKEVWHYHSTDGGRPGPIAICPACPPTCPTRATRWWSGRRRHGLHRIIGYNQDDFSKGGLFVARSTDNGATWSTRRCRRRPKQPGQIFNDKEWMAVDRSAHGHPRHALPHLDALHRPCRPQDERGDIVESAPPTAAQTWSAPVRGQRAPARTTCRAPSRWWGRTATSTCSASTRQPTGSFWLARSDGRRPELRPAGQGGRRHAARRRPCRPAASACSCCPPADGQPAWTARWSSTWNDYAEQQRRPAGHLARQRAHLEPRPRA